MLRARFNVVCSTGGTLYLDDLANRHQTMSVTNDADEVVKWCLRKFPRHRIVYRDTDGRWDQLCHDGEKFTGFKSWKGWTPR